MPAPPPSPQPVTAREGCAADQVRTTTEVVDVCIDLYEAPGFGAPPQHFSFAAAATHCAERGRRLCAEQEWEAACRGPAGQLYPYGDEFDPEACVVGASRARSVGNANSCRSGFGAYDMSGNAAEWVDGPLMKGGDFASDAFGARCGARARAAAAEESLSGVRCCSAPQL
ncbi:MAG: sulfatase activating formylglycine-generating enzyme [Bradymonadia bacterium]|jgi:formylglycine-generating enzyme required for sulfatase activity